jgi:hypothetical protein
MPHATATSNSQCSQTIHLTQGEKISRSPETKIEIARFIDPLDRKMSGI